MGLIDLAVSRLSTGTGTDVPLLKSMLTTLQTLVNGNLDGSNVGVMPAARVFHNAAQVIATSTTTALAFNSERFDTDTIHDTATNNSRLTCKTAGIYLISAAIEWAPDATGFRNASIRVNGGSAIAIEQVLNAGATNNVRLTPTTLYYLAINDYVELVVFQNSGGDLNVTANPNFSPEFSMARLSA